MYVLSYNRNHGTKHCGWIMKQRVHVQKVKMARGQVCHVYFADNLVRWAKPLERTVSFDNLEIILAAFVIKWVSTPVP